MRFGEVPCSGDLAHEPCTACRLQVRGVPAAIGRLAGAVPARLVELISSSPLPTGVKLLVTAGTRDADRRAWVHEIVDHTDRFVAASSWLKDVLLRNGVPGSRIVVCGQGVDLSSSRSATWRAMSSEGPLKVGFVGRFDPVKGVHVLIDAAAFVPESSAIEVHVWGIARSQADQAYKREMIRRAAANPRVIFHDETQDTATVYSSIDVLAVPSQWLETGPLVVLEAHAAGIPVVGSNTGGIAERVTHGEDGLLVPVADAKALADALVSLAADRRRLEALRPKRAPRTVADVARETLITYRALVARAA
jgi:glycosyltransferase involved in cell wall biosynthesis